MEYIIFSAIVGFIIGTLFYYYDRKSGKNLYRKWHNLSNKEKLHETATIGFVDGRLFGQKLKIAIAIAVVFYLLTFLMAGIPLKGLLYAGAVFIGALSSFYISGTLLSLFSKRASQTIDYIESIEKGEKNIKDELKSILPKKEEEKISFKKETEVSDKKEQEEAPKEDKKKDDWRDGINKFLDK